MKIRYYMVCSRFEALIASHLEPEAFGTYMAVGTKKLASGHVAFFEIDPGVPDVHRPFPVDDIETRCAPHEDGSPKRSKYISRLPGDGVPAAAGLRAAVPDDAGRARAAAGRERRTTSGGRDAGREPLPGALPAHPDGGVDAGAGGVRAGAHQPGATRCTRRGIFFADLRLDRDAQGRLAGWLPYTDPLHIEDCIEELEQADASGKATKTVSRTPRTRGFLRVIRRGFFLGDQTGVKFYRFPTREELEIHHSKWWHSASAQ